MKEFLTTTEVGQRLGVSRQHVARLVGRGDIPAVRHGRCIRVPRDAWEEWLRRQSAAALDTLKGKAMIYLTHTTSSR